MNILKKTFMLLLITTVISLCLTGCKDAEKESAIAEAAATKTELAKVKAELGDAISKLDTAVTDAKNAQTIIENLKGQLSVQTQKIEDQNKTIQKMIGQAKDIKENLVGMTQERASAIAELTISKAAIEIFKSQLKDQTQKITGLEGKNKKLQEMIEEMKKKLSGKTEIPSIPKL